MLGYKFRTFSPAGSAEDAIVMIKQNRNHFNLEIANRYNRFWALQSPSAIRELSHVSFKNQADDGRISAWNDYSRELMHQSGNTSCATASYHISVCVTHSMLQADEKEFLPQTVQAHNSKPCWCYTTFRPYRGRVYIKMLILPQFRKRLSKLNVGKV